MILKGVFNMKKYKFLVALSIALGAFGLEARTYWNGTRYVEVADRYSRRAEATECTEDLGVRPESYKDRESYLNDYIEQELGKLTAAQRNEDRKILGGEKTRRFKIRRDGERLWKNAHEKQKKEAEEESKYLAGAPLYRLFDIELGSTPSLQDYWRIGDSNTYEFKPKKNFRSYKKYVFSITPITHKIYGIRASDMDFNDVEREAGQEVIKTEWEATKVALEKKFEKVAKLEIGTMVCPNFKLLFPNKDKKVTREISVVFGVSITAVDLELKKLAEAEREIINRRVFEKAVETDVDAL